MADISSQLAQLQKLRAGRMQGEEARLLNARGRQLVIRLNLLMRTSSIHDVRNEALQRSIDFLIQAAGELLEQFCPVVLQGDQDQIYLNDYRIRGDATVYSNTRALLQELAKLGAGGMTFHQALTRSDVLALLTVLRDPAFPTLPRASGENARALADERVAQVNAALEGQGVSAISFNRYLELGAGADVRRLAQRDRVTVALKTYTKVLVAVKRTTLEGAALKALERLKLLKNVQALIDLCFDDEVFFEGLSSLKCDGDYSYFHPVHVAMLSIQMGKQLGLNRKLLMELALAALYYDLGRLSLGAGILNKSGPLNAEEWDEVRRHPLRSAKEILRARTLDEGVRKRLLVAFEHHLGYNGGGYPQRIHERMPHLFSRIVAIADAYDALTTERPFRDGHLPAEALRIMLDDGRYDPVLMRILVNLLQIYPLGTLVLLDTREVGAVYHHQSDPEFQGRPIVRLQLDGSGRAIKPTLINLAERDSEGRYLRTIVRSLEPDPLHAGSSRP